VLPGSTAELQSVVRLAAARALPITVRGGGASYTDGYTHTTADGITIGTDRLTAIEIDETNNVVTVEPGVTWARLHAALGAKGLRTPFWGPFSGLTATVGGSISQNAISHGPGVSADSVVAFDIVTGTGELLRTGSGGRPKGVPFFRHDGPDLTGLFCGDCGTLGVKARITLKLQRRHEAFAALSLSFTSFAAMHAAMSEIAREGLDDENFGLDAALQQGRSAATRASRQRRKSPSR
jgi:D-lactate dehydrogenase (cytochrome)